VTTLYSWAILMMVRLDPENFASVSQEKCLIRFGKPTINLIRSHCKVSFLTDWINAASAQAGVLGARPSSWVLLRTRVGCLWP
jgi:hypothetical protein